MKSLLAFGLFRFAQAASLLLLSAFITEAAFAQSVSYYKFTPPVIRSTETQNILFEVRVIGASTRVALDFSPAGSQPLLDLLDNGTNGDRQAEDGIYSVTLTPTQVLQGLSTDDVFRRFIGFLRLFQGTTVTSSYNIIAAIHTPEIPPVVVQELASDMQSTDYVVNIYDPAYFSATNRDDYLNNISKRLYQAFGDVYDMLDFVSVTNYIANAHHIGVKNDIQGIGQRIFDNSAARGSNGTLLGFNVFPNESLFDGAATVYIHEFGHQWIQFMQLVPFSIGIPHWPISSLASGVMGFSIPPTSQGGTYNCRLVSETGGVRLQPDDNPKTFTDFDLYMMGLVAEQEVGEHIVFDDQNDPTIRQCNGQLYTGPITRVHASDVVAAFGPRIPNVATSPKSFRVATVVISSDGLLSPEAMAFYTFFAKRAEATQALATHIGLAKGLSNPFVTATGNRANLVAALVTISPAALPDASFATAYSKLLNQSGLLGVPNWSISAGALPPGLMLDAASGVLSGAPTMPGTFHFTVRASSNNYFSEHAYSLHVGQGAPVITVTAPAPNIVGNLVSYAVTVKPEAIGSPNPTGEVQFKLNGNAIGNAISPVNGIASLTLDAPATGAYRVSVDYSGDSNYLAGSSTANTKLFVFQYSVRDDRSGDYILFNATPAARNIPRGGFYINSCGHQLPPIPARTGIGAVSGGKCTITLTHLTSTGSNSFQVILNTCRNQGVVTNGSVTNPILLLCDSDTTNNTGFCR